MSIDPARGARPTGTREPRFVSQLTRNTFAMILEGERCGSLHELTDWRSKPAVAFGGKFRIIDFALSNCVNSGVRRVGVATQYRAQSLIRHLQLGWSFLDGRLGEFIEIMPAQQQVHEGQWYQGSADAVFQNLREIRHAAPAYVLVLPGDHIYRMDYGNTFAAKVSSWIVPMIVLAEICSWYAVLTTSNIGHVLEESLWGFSPALLVASFLFLWPRSDRNHRTFLVMVSAFGTCYVVHKTHSPQIQ
ncbi:MAG: hypothetical protein K9K38_05120 [Rhodoferax sp.]|nr:hypothetical protein [Rhodoferax sp.]MCF8208775.1 hypothetical protein [Rhodoferax sp.]